MDDLDEQLQLLGYGDQWIPQIEALALRKKNSSDLSRVQLHNKQFPQLHKAAKRRWAQKRAAQIKNRAGKQKCNRCFRLMTKNDLIGQNRLKGHCKKCRKELLS